MKSGSDDTVRNSHQPKQTKTVHSFYVLDVLWSSYQTECGMRGDCGFPVCGGKNQRTWQITQAVPHFPRLCALIFLRSRPSPAILFHVELQNLRVITIFAVLFLPPGPSEGAF
jgi:hypothetical protein